MYSPCNILITFSLFSQCYQDVISRNIEYCSRCKGIVRLAISASMTKHTLQPPQAAHSPHVHRSYTVCLGETRIRHASVNSWRSMSIDGLRATCYRPGPVGLVPENTNRLWDSEEPEVNEHGLPTYASAAYLRSSVTDRSAQAPHLQAQAIISKQRETDDVRLRCRLVEGHSHR